MSRIIVDDLRRRWWVWGLIGLACLVCVLCVDANQNFFYGALYPAILGAAVLGLQMRNGRVLLTLPFTARQIGRTVWILIVVIPSLLLALFTGPGIYLCNHYKFFTNSILDSTLLPPALAGGFLAAWIQLVIVGSLGFGSAFWLFTKIPPIREQRNNLRTQLYGAGLLIAVIGGGYLLARSTIGDEIKFAIIFLLGVFFTVRGWFRAEGMVIGLGTYRNEAAGVDKPKEMFKPRAGYGGIPFLIMNCCIRYIAAMALLTVIVGGIIVWFQVIHPDPVDPPIKRSDVLDFMRGFSFYSFFLNFWMILPIAVHQKFLRSLPLTSRELAAVILCMAAVPFLMLSGIAVLFEIPAFGVPAAGFLLGGHLLFLPPLCVIATAIVWNNERKFLRFVIAVVVFSVSAVPAIYHLFWTSEKGLPLWMVILIPLVSLLLALYIINRLLQRNDMTYRAQMQTFISPETPMW